MFERSAVPDSFQRWDLVVTGAFVGFERIARVRADSSFQNLETLLVIRWSVKTIHRDEFVVGVEWWRVALSTPLALENLLAARCRGVEPIWIRWRLKRIEVKCEGE